MKVLSGDQAIEQLEKKRGGYFVLKVDAKQVNQLDNKNKTRLICQLDNTISFQCGLNHYGDGHFFIIISTKNINTIHKKAGDVVHFEIYEDPNPLGVAIPVTVEILLEQDEILKEKFEKLTDGKKRSILIQINKIKDIDKQISKTMVLINNPDLGRLRKI